MRAPALGTLNERVEIFTKVTVLDAGGGQETSFVSLGLAWARVVARAMRGEVADAAAAISTHEIVLRHRRDIAPGDRVMWRGRALEVIGAADLNGRRAYTLLRCRAMEAMG